MAVRSRRVLQVRVDCVDMDGALAGITRMVEERGPTRMVATVNPEFVMRARRDPDFRRALEGSALAVADGIGVVWALRRRGCPRQERVTGTDLVPRLAGLAAARGWRLSLLGAAPGVAAEAAARLQDQHPGLVIAGAQPGSPQPQDDPATVAAVNQQSPDVVLVAYGHPKQELWIARNQPRLTAPVAIGVGGAFDFIAGRVRRAPAPLRRAHLEWAWRLVREPWRARRMLALPRFALAVLAEGRGE
jgi:N-acetylglucosaminyldiphosphoundecaprenol N-acetyl-beta-D-mannosaminyltransferase